MPYYIKEAESFVLLTDNEAYRRQQRAGLKPVEPAEDVQVSFDHFERLPDWKISADREKYQQDLALYQSKVPLYVPSFDKIIEKANQKFGTLKTNYAALFQELQENMAKTENTGQLYNVLLATHSKVSALVETRSSSWCPPGSLLISALMSFGFFPVSRSGSRLKDALEDFFRDNFYCSLHYKNNELQINPLFEEGKVFKQLAEVATVEDYINKDPTSIVMGYL